MHAESVFAARTETIRLPLPISRRDERFFSHGCLLELASFFPTIAGGVSLKGRLVAPDLSRVGSNTSRNHSLMTFPSADGILRWMTMLQVRCSIDSIRFALLRTREITLTAQRIIVRKKIAEFPLRGSSSMPLIESTRTVGSGD